MLLPAIAGVYAQIHFKLMIMLRGELPKVIITVNSYKTVGRFNGLAQCTHSTMVLSISLTVPNEKPLFRMKSFGDIKMTQSPASTTSTAEKI